MGEETTLSLVWWITAVELPALAALFWMIHHGRKDAERAAQRMQADIHAQLAALLDNLTRFKLEVARSYVTAGELKDLEKRLTGHLLRLEDRVIHLSAQGGESPRRVLELVGEERREGRRRG